MKRLLILATLAVAASCVASEPSDAYVERLSSAIYQAEGGKAAAFQYGIIAKRKLSQAEAKRWCQNTIRNNWHRWEQAGSKGDYLVFLAGRYCPIGAANDPKGLNRNWLKNVRSKL